MVIEPGTKSEVANGSSLSDGSKNNKSNGAGAQKKNSIGKRRALFVFQVLIGYEVEVKVRLLLVAHLIFQRPGLALFRSLYLIFLFAVA